MAKMIGCTLKCLLLSFLISSADAQALKKAVTGIIKDADGKAIPSATVQEKGTKNQAVADGNGRFTISVAPGTVLLCTSVGFEPKEVKTGDGSFIEVSLQINTSSLEDVTITTALGIEKIKKKIGYSISVIDSKDILKTSPTNFAAALYGKVPGLSVNANPGGATSAVALQLRGINSISYQMQPLLVLDGIIMRNTLNNTNGGRLAGNGLLDVNPEDIDNIIFLKGAAAAALYGSDANFGVIVINTKHGKAKTGMGISFNSSVNVEEVALVPDLQTEYGPGYDRATNMALYGADDEGWIHRTINGADVVSPAFRAYGQFGPKIDGRDVYWWDGEMRQYTVQPNNMKSFYRKGVGSIQNVSFNDATDKISYRFSYTRNDYRGIQIGGKQEKNTFNLNLDYKLSKRLTAELTANYVNEKVHNRPAAISPFTQLYDGYFSPVEKMDLLFSKYKTTKGYKYVKYNETQLDPEEAFKYNIRPYNFLDFLWNQKENVFDETTNRIIAGITLNYKILDNLKIRGRVGSDYTGYFSETKNRSTQPISFGPTGEYRTASNRYNYSYGDVLISWLQKLTKDLNLNLSAGYQARKEEYQYTGQNTNGGLTQENWFTLNASAINPPTGSSSRKYMVKDGLFAILGLDYKKFLFLEGTVRRERISTLYTGNNSFVYPAVSGAFEFSNAFHLPAFISYGKLRASYGIVGNGAPPYTANIVYNAGSINGIPTFTPQSVYGNEGLKNEEKHELEFGLETRLLKNRISLDVSWYSNTNKKQILPLQVPTSTGSSGEVVNVGTLKNTGLEIGINGSVLQRRNFSWDATANFAFNNNKVVSLMEGLDQLQLYSLDNASLVVVAKKGAPSGDIMGYKRRTDEQGRYVINDDGYYDIDFDEQQKMGNIQSKVTGGLTNTFTYKNISLSVLTDFRWGGQIVSLSNFYGEGAGLFKSSLYGRDAENGGLPYYADAGGKFIGVPAGTSAGPGGEKIYHDGMVLNGATADGKANSTIIDAPNFYLNTYSWGSWPGSGSYSTYEGAVFDNNYVKLREASLTYSMPLRLRSKIKMQQLSFSLYGRNLFYIYKSLPNLDPEESEGVNYTNLSIAGGANAATRSYGASIRLSF